MYVYLLKNLRRKKTHIIYMMGFLFLILALFVNISNQSASEHASCYLETTQLSPKPHVKANEIIKTVIHQISSKTLYFGAGAILGSGSFVSRLIWAACQLTPSTKTTAEECLLFSSLTASSSKHLFKQLLKTKISNTPSSNFSVVPPSLESWHLNKSLLEDIPVSTNQDRELLLFLERRWLAKSTGFFPSLVDWVCPCFGITVQVHPKTTSTYARNPAIKLSQTYEHRMNSLKKKLPHPGYYPLILTRHLDLKDYLPLYLEALKEEEIQTIVKKALSKAKSAQGRIILDLTHVLPISHTTKKNWLENWKSYQNIFIKQCNHFAFDLKKIVCIQRIEDEGLAGIRILPFVFSSAKETDANERFLLEWIGRFGLSANWIELDRYFGAPAESGSNYSPTSVFGPALSHGKFIAFLHSFEQNWHSCHPQKTLMVKGALHLLRGMIESVSQKNWNAIFECPTKSSVLRLSLLKIQQHLSRIEQDKNKTFFFETASNIEQIHADLSSLLEILSPFSANDFAPIYQNHLKSVPESCKSLISCGVHSSGMTTLAGILKATENTIGGTPRVLYGANTYFECILAAKSVSNASPILDASEKDLQQADLILAQFNPVLRRIDLPPSEYQVEPVIDFLRRCLEAKRDKPLTIALDCTIDFIDSPRVGELIYTFQHEIEAGVLNVICYRSGLKFDLFGMDNYSGAPFYMIHNQESKWAHFERLIRDPVLQTDRLSLNWFCLAYKYAANDLELYRKQIFDNTRDLLNKIPSNLFDSHARYRVIPVEQGADAAFIDFKISGPLHQMRGAALAGGCLFLKCMESGHPIFYRPSLGFYHPNFTMLFSKECSTIRLTLGLDPAQVDIIAECFKTIDKLNGSS